MKNLQKVVLVFALIAVVLIGATQLGRATDLLKHCNIVCVNEYGCLAAPQMTCVWDCAAPPGGGVITCQEYHDVCNCDDCGCSGNP